MSWLIVCHGVNIGVCVIVLTVAHFCLYVCMTKFILAYIRCIDRTQNLCVQFIVRLYCDKLFLCADSA